MTDAAHSIVVICEGPTDQRTARALAERVLCQAVDWMEPEVLEHLIQWRGLRKNEPYFAWRQSNALAQANNVRTNGRFDDAPDAFMARRALAVLTILGERDFDAVLLLRDSDADTQRRQGLEQARAQTSGLGPIVIGVAHAKRECWVLAGFIAANDEEQSRLDVCRQELGFDPCLQAEQLTAATPGAKRDAKRVLGELTQEDYPREAACWTDTPLDQLEERGQATGLADFFREVRERLVPVWTR